MKFTPIPAIDILGGKVVRLRQGSYSDPTVHEADPAKVAAKFAEHCWRIHVVDLDGARLGKQSNVDSIMKVFEAAKKTRPDVELQVGGGIRSHSVVGKVLEAGASYIVLGTAALEEEGFLEKACLDHKGKVLISLDTLDGKLAVSGWTRITEIDGIDFAIEAEQKGVAGIIHTDIRKDGMQQGPNIHVTSTLSDKVSCPVYASGGVRTIEDLEALQKTGIAGVIIGKAMYTGNIKVEELSRFGNAND